MRTFALSILAALAAAAPARAAPTVKIGALFAVTGPASFLGAPEARTAQMVVEELNARGGLGGAPIELLVKDTAGSPEKAVSLAKQLIEEEGVLAILGPSTSGETLAVKAIAEEGRTLLISLSAAEAIVQPLARYVFKTAQKDSHAATRILQQMQKMGIKKIAVLTSNTGFGKAGKEQLEKLAPAHGVEIALSEVYDKAATDLTAEVTKVKGANVQALVNWSIEPAQAIVVKNARQLGLTLPIFQSHGFANVQYAKAAGPAAEGVLFPAGRLVIAEHLSDKDPQKAVLLAYKKAYEARFKEEASTFGGHAYDALQILAKAVQQAGGTDREKVRAAVEGLQLVGTAGAFHFSPTDHNGLGIDAFEMVTVKGGQFVPLGG
jgi:branched-chain amino acid transport system substrate-binding protein